ncbi:MAG TPA: HTH-type transcriptional activator IlvY [Pontiella sp.]|nr:HTH-type transcriptional activator IlvY [Pontiella sp.]
MDTQALETFIKTAELLHFGKASRACNLSPSALTRTIQRLEEEIGQPLFLRDNRSVALTDTGSRLLAYAHTTLQEWQHFQESIATDGRQITGTLSVYASITAVYSLLPDLLEAYRSTYPDVQLALRTGVAERAIEQVTSGEIDLAVAALPDQQFDRLEFMPLIETPLVFIRQKSVAMPKKIDWSAVPLVLPQSGTARHRLDAWMKTLGIVPNIALEVSGNEALIAMVRLGAGIGIVPQLALERSPLHDDVSVIKTAPQLDPYSVGLCSSRRSLKRPAVKAMWELAERL